MILDLYRIIFGFLIMIAELRISKLLVWFSFLLYFVGMGGFEIFVGGLALGTSEAYEYAITAVLCTVGLLYCGLGCCCSDIEKNTQGDLSAKVIEEQSRLV